MNFVQEQLIRIKLLLHFCSLKIYLKILRRSRFVFQNQEQLNFPMSNTQQKDWTFQDNWKYFWHIWRMYMCLYVVCLWADVCAQKNCAYFWHIFLSVNLYNLSLEGVSELYIGVLRLNSLNKCPLCTLVPMHQSRHLLLIRVLQSHKSLKSKKNTVVT